MASFIFCANCGTKIPTELKFCFNCGKEIVLPKNFNQEAVGSAQSQPVPAPAAPSFTEPAAPAVTPAPVFTQAPEPVQPQPAEPVYRTETAVRPFSIPEEPKKEEVETAPAEEPVAASPEPEEMMQDSVTIIYRPPVKEKEKPEPIMPVKSTEPAKEEEKKETSSSAIPAGKILASSIPQEELTNISLQTVDSDRAVSEPAKPETPAVKETPVPSPAPAPQPAAPAVNPAPVSAEPAKAASAALDFDYIFEQANLQRNANAAAAPKTRNRRRFDPETGLPRSRVS